MLGDCRRVVYFVNGRDLFGGPCEWVGSISWPSLACLPTGGQLHAQVFDKIVARLRYLEQTMPAGTTAMVEGGEGS